MTIRISLGTVLAALVLIAIGAGTAVGVMLWEPWDGDGEGTMTTEQQSTPPAQRAPTQAEREAEEVRICLDAQQAAADFRVAEEAEAARQQEEGVIVFTRPVPDSIQNAIDRYCK